MVDIVEIGLRVDSKDVKVASRELDQLGDQSDKTSRKTESLIGSFKAAAAAAAAYYATMKLVVEPLLAAANAANEAAHSQARLAAVLKTTGGAAGLTSRQLNQMADELAGVTLFDDESIRNSEAIMLSFRNVQGETFREGMTLAADMASLFGNDLKGAVTQMGKALNEPREGVSALSRAGVTYSAVQKDQINNFVETNQLARAQALILAEVKGQLGGTAEAMAKADNGTTSMKKAYGELAETIGNNLLPFTQALNKELKFIADQLNIRFTAPTERVDQIRAEIDAVREQIKETGPLEWAARKRLALQERELMSQYTIAVTLARERKSADEEAAKKSGEIAAQTERAARAQAQLQEAKTEARKRTDLRPSSGEDEEFGPTENQLATAMARQREAAEVLEQGRQEQAQARLMGVEASFQTEAEAMESAYTNRLFIVEDALQRGLISEEKYRSLETQLWAQNEAEKSRLAQEGINQRIAQEQAAAQIIQQSQSATFSAVGNLFGVFAAKSKAAALAQLAITKGYAIFEILARSKIAAAMALGPPLGPVAGAPLAASITAWGYANAAAVGASGVAGAIQINQGNFGSGSASTGGVGGSGSGGSTTSASAPAPAAAPAARGVTQITIVANNNGIAYLDEASMIILQEKLRESNLRGDSFMLDMKSANVQAIIDAARSQAA